MFKSRKAQGCPGEARRAQESAGQPKTAQERTGKEVAGSRQHGAGSRQQAADRQEADRYQETMKAGRQALKKPTARRRERDFDKNPSGEIAKKISTGERGGFLRLEVAARRRGRTKTVKKAMARRRERHNNKGRIWRDVQE